MLVGGASKSSACIRCTDFDTCRGYTCSGLPGSGCCGQCICVGPESSTAYVYTLHPGFVTSQVAGHLVVSSVMEDSPAEKAGVLPGDELVLVNEKRSGELDCSSKGWQSERTSQVANLVFRRGKTEQKVAVELVPISHLLAARWERPNTTLASLGSVWPRATGRSLGEYGNYMFGIRWRKDGARLFVSELLRGSPAETAGISIGDEIVSVDGISAQERGPEVEARLRPSDYRTQVQLVLRRGSRMNNIRLDAAGLSEILRRRTDTYPADAPKVANLATSN